MSSPRDRIEARLGLTGPPLQQVRTSPPQIPDHELIRRFEPLSRSNEGFVDILQVGRDEVDGWFYYVMELADAAEPQASDQCSVISNQSQDASVRETASAALNTDHCSLITTYTPRTLSRDLHQRGRLPLDQCLELGLPLTLALGHLHRHGLIHRDIKPSNIIFVGGVPKLADIGLVTEAEGANTFVGTEGFVPPEGPTSPQADLYALGKVLYEAAMGKERNEFPEPFTHIGTDQESVALMELNAVLLRACAPDPKARYASAEEMHADLALLHSGGSVKRRHRFERQFRIAKQVGAAAVVATLLIDAGWFWQRQQTGKMTRLATEKSELADANARLASEKGAAASESRRRLIQTQTANGLRAMDENDPATAALWFAEVLQRFKGDVELERRQRERLAALFRVLPKPIARLSLECDGSSVRTSPDGRWIIGVGASQTGEYRTGEVKIWDASSFRPLHSVVLSNIWGNHVSPSGRWALVSDPQGNRLCAVLDGMRVTTPLPFGGHGERSAFASDESKLAMTAWQGSEVQISAVAVFGISQPSDASATEQNSVKVIELPSGKARFAPLSHRNILQSAAFSPDGRYLATGTAERLVTIWDAQTGEAVHRSLKHENGSPQLLRFTPDGTWLAVTGVREIRVWEVRTGKTVAALESGEAGFNLDSNQRTAHDVRVSPEPGRVESGWDISGRAEWRSYRPCLGHGHGQGAFFQFAARGRRALHGV